MARTTLLLQFHLLQPARTRPSQLFQDAVTRLRFVHSPGEVETNAEPIPGGRAAADWWSRKLSYQRQFRFTIAFENATLPGYT